MVSHRSRASWVVLALLGALLGLGLATAAPASAAVREVLLDASEDARTVTVKAGDVVRFIVPAEGDGAETAEHRVVSTTAEGADPNWPTEDGNYDSGPIAPGAFVDTPAFPAGTYTFEDRRSLVVAAPPQPARTVAGTVTATKATAGPTPSRSPTAKPAPGASGRPTTGPPGPSAQPTGTSTAPVPIGGGTGVLPPLSGGFSVPTLPPGAPGPGPQVAPTLAGEEPSLTPEQRAEQVAVRAGRLPQGATDRLFGTLAALGAVAALGTASLLVRLLLAHPAARPASAATVD